MFWLQIMFGISKNIIQILVALLLLTVLNHLIFASLKDLSFSQQILFNIMIGKSVSYLLIIFGKLPRNIVWKKFRSARMIYIFTFCIIYFLSISSIVNLNQFSWWKIKFSKVTLKRNISQNLMFSKKRVKIVAVHVQLTKTFTIVHILGWNCTQLIPIKWDN